MTYRCSEMENVAGEKGREVETDREVSRKREEHRKNVMAVWEGILMGNIQSSITGA